MKSIKVNILLIVLFIVSVNIYAQEAQTQLYLSISHEIADYTSWKVGFDNHVSARQAAGITDIFVKRDINNTSSITFFAKISSLEKAKDFVSDPKLKEAMAQAGVTSAPEIAFYKSATEYQEINTSALVTTVTHSVKDFSAWKDVYDSAHELRKSAGITDHLLLKSVSDENVVTVLGTSSSAARFNEFMMNPDLKGAMQKGGVTSKPQVEVLL